MTPEDRGELQVVGADGTRYSLNIPAGAVIELVEISAAPMVSIAGLPFQSGIQAGISLGPEGPVLAKPATPTATRPAGFDGKTHHAASDAFSTAFQLSQ